MPALQTPWKRVRSEIITGLLILAAVVFLLPLLYGDSIPSFPVVLIYAAVLVLVLGIKLAVMEWLARRRLAAREGRAAR
jgi:thiol:disulfide interchange protein